MPALITGHVTCDSDTNRRFVLRRLSGKPVTVGQETSSQWIRNLAFSYIPQSHEESAEDLLGLSRNAEVVL
jgi:hypothetical protein